MFSSLAETYRPWHRWFRSGPPVAKKRLAESSDDVATVSGKGQQACHPLPGEMLHTLYNPRGNLNKQGSLTGGLKYTTASKLIIVDAICLRYMQRIFRK